MANMKMMKEVKTASQEMKIEGRGIDNSLNAKMRKKSKKEEV